MRPFALVIAIGLTANLSAQWPNSKVTVFSGPFSEEKEGSSEVRSLREGANVVWMKTEQPFKGKMFVSVQEMETGVDVSKWEVNTALAVRGIMAAGVSTAEVWAEEGMHLVYFYWNTKNKSMELATQRWDANTGSSAPPLRPLHSIPVKFSFMGSELPSSYHVKNYSPDGSKVAFVNRSLKVLGERNSTVHLVHVLDRASMNLIWSAGYELDDDFKEEGFQVDDEGVVFMLFGPGSSAAGTKNDTGYRLHRMQGEQHTQTSLELMPNRRTKYLKFVADPQGPRLSGFVLDPNDNKVVSDWILLSIDANSLATRDMAHGPLDRSLKFSHTVGNPLRLENGGFVRVAKDYQASSMSKVKGLLELRILAFGPGGDLEWQKALTLRDPADEYPVEFMLDDRFCIMFAGDPSIDGKGLFPVNDKTKLTDRPKCFAMMFDAQGNSEVVPATVGGQPVYQDGVFGASIGPGRFYASANRVVPGGKMNDYVIIELDK